LVFPWQQQFLVFHWLRTVNATFSISQAASISLIMAESPAQPFPASILLQISPGSWPGRNGKANFLNKKKGPGTTGLDISLFRL